MTEAVTVRRDRIRPVPGISPTLSTSKFFDIKILPASDCAPWFTFQFHAKPMIPIDQGRGVPPSAQSSPVLGTSPQTLFSGRNPQAAIVWREPEARSKKMDQRMSDSAKSKADEDHAERSVEAFKRLSGQGDSVGWTFDR